MTRDEIIRMAREAGCSEPSHPMNDLRVSQEALERFAAIVAAAERETIAKKFDGPVWSYDYREIAAAIRARGE